MIVGIQILQPIPSKSGFNRVTRLYIGGYKIVANFFGLSAKFLADNAESGFYSDYLTLETQDFHHLRQFFWPEKWIPPIFPLL